MLGTADTAISGERTAPERPNAAAANLAGQGAQCRSRQSPCTAKAAATTVSTAAATSIIHEVYEARGPAVRRLPMEIAAARTIPAAAAPRPHGHERGA